jgi:hypothetical protein
MTKNNNKASTPKEEDMVFMAVFGMSVREFKKAHNMTNNMVLMKHLPDHMLSLLKDAKKRNVEMITARYPFSKRRDILIDSYKCENISYG